MKKIAAGILAHVDSGKTTLSEGLLFSSGEIRKRGRVDHGDTFLDTDTMEKERGITIFSKQAVLKTENGEITLLDTPGHVDFSAETERVLSVLDYAVLVINGCDGVQSHTETLWYILKNNNIPTFIFVNKMDISSYSADTLLKNLRGKLDDNCVNFSKKKDESFYESVAMCSEEAMSTFLESGEVDGDTIAQLIKERKMFPCFFGSALKQEGVDEFLKVFDRYTLPAGKRENFAARVFKITQDEQGNRLTHLKVLGKSIKVKDVICGVDKNGNEWSEKINSIRIYSGNKFKVTDEAVQGTVCAVMGLTKTFAGEGLGEEKSMTSFSLEPVFSYKVQINDKTDTAVVLSKLRILEEEEPQLQVYQNSQLSEIHLRIMGEIQCEILKRIVFERFNIDIDFAQGSILYKETVAEAIEGVGHYEPLRHYSEVHLLIEPGERGSGVIFASDCSEDVLAKNWQRLILTHLEEKTHMGVLIGAPLTDVKITLIAGRAHLKHTEGGDFRQATYRAVRHGLMRAKNVLLEPWYEFEVEVPTECLGRVMNDIENMGGKIELPENDGDTARLKGSAPVEKIRDYQKEITVFSKGKGHIFCKMSGYQPCGDSEAVIEKAGYDAEADTENSADSVFCAKGAGFLVKWYDVENYMHLPFLEDREKDEEIQPAAPVKRKNYADVSEEELIAIYERTYGKIKERRVSHKLKTEKKPQVTYKGTTKPKKYDKTYLLVDGYNIIFASEALKKTAGENLDLARNLLIARLCNFKAVKEKEVIIVFDAYKVAGKYREIEKINGIHVVYTKEAETADAYIEKTTHELSKNNRVEVASSDNLEQIIILGTGAIRISADAFLKELNNTEKEIEDMINDFNKRQF